MKNLEKKLINNDSNISNSTLAIDTQRLYELVDSGNHKDFDVLSILYMEKYNLNSNQEFRNLKLYETYHPKPKPKKYL